MGPIWDYNGALGNADYFCCFLTEGWHYEFDDSVCMDEAVARDAVARDGPEL